VGKSFLACALAQKACRDGYSELYTRAAALHTLLLKDARGKPPGSHWTEAPWIILVKDACPLVFVFLITYYVERIAFFDVLIKKAAVAFFSRSLLAVHFTWPAPWMNRYRLGASAMSSRR
jgi:hypothetical protein